MNTYSKKNLIAEGKSSTLTLKEQWNSDIIYLSSDIFLKIKTKTWTWLHFALIVYKMFEAYPVQLNNCRIFYRVNFWPCKIQH